VTQIHKMSDMNHSRSIVQEVKASQKARNWRHEKVATTLV